MSRDEETDDPIAAGQHAAPGDPVNFSKREPFAEASGPSSYVSVFIDTDGSASIDGVPVHAARGQAVDEAVLDTLHRHARELNSPVTAAISDPAFAEVTFVEVAPDGSSKLVEEPLMPPPPGSSEDATETAAPLKLFGQADAGHSGRAPYDAPEPGPSGVGAPIGGSPDDGFREDDLHDDFNDDPDDGLEESRFAPPRPSLPRPSLSSFSPRVPSLSLPRRSRGAGARATRQSDDEYRASGLLHRPLVVGLVALGVAVLVIVPLVILGSGSDGDGGQNEAVGTSDKLNKSPERKPKTSPTVSVSPSLVPPPSFSASPTAKPKPKDRATVTVRPPEVRTTVTAKPSAETAATAVNRLATNDPGRHICYRAYVSGSGWQKPVCDGTVAGTTGQNRAIKALNIAVRGTGGVAANAFVHNANSTDGRGVWMPHWTPITDDGKNIYIGSAKKSAPNMLGFAINIGSGGKICQVARNHNADWSHLACVNPRPEYTFGGTLSNDVWLEAVRFSV